MKTLYTVFEDINLDLCGSQYLISNNTKAFNPGTNLFGQFFNQFKISKSDIKWGLTLASKAVIKESLGAEVDIELVVMLFAGYLSLIKKSLNSLQINTFKKLPVPAARHRLTYN